MNAHGDFCLDMLVGDSLVDRLETALWVYDFDGGRIVWANRAALALWGADSAQALARRDMGAEMSLSVRTRLAQHHQDFELAPTRAIHELWTLYPDGRPFRVRAVLRRCVMPGGRVGMLVEARAHEPATPETVRSADALLHTKVMTALYDADGAELYANPAHRGAIGPGARPFAATFVDPAKAAAFLAGLADAPEHRATAQIDTVVGPRWHDLHAVRCRDAVTGDRAFVVSATDVTAERERQQALKAARDAAEAAARARSVFLATMSHEMRTPLNGVLGLARVLSCTALDDPQKRLVGAIATSGERMLELIENLLDMVALDGGAMSLRRAPFEPALALRAATEPFRAEAEAKGLSLVVEAPPCGARCVHDATLIRKALRQLVSNAVKFTDAGGIIVRAAATDDGALRFEVKDTGPGVDAAAQARIFDRFHQVDDSTTRRQGGAGLGLAVCAEMVELWGGEIGVDSEPGRGATFWFTAPGAVTP